ncbi:MAG: hemolysin III family protein [Sandaracinaceae bacterium]|jgi:hemolysin III|nr:hemolysin III family protein [Sandaracinaceae bacterium]
MSATTLPLVPTRHEELVHSTTHAAGALFSLATLVVLISRAVSRSAPLVELVALSLFGGSLLLLYTCSAIYHAIPHHGAQAKTFWRVLDHSAIYLLIAGTYTPFALLGNPGAATTWLLGGVWCLASVGIIVEVSPLRKRKRLSLLLYLATGWIGVLGLPAMWQSLSRPVLTLLMLGGIAYTAGVPFYSAKHKRWMHAYWHVFVMLGSTLHALAVGLLAA